MASKHKIATCLHYKRYQIQNEGLKIVKRCHFLILFFSFGPPAGHKTSNGQFWWNILEVYSLWLTEKILHIFWYFHLRLTAEADVDDDNIVICHRPLCFFFTAFCFFSFPEHLFDMTLTWHDIHCDLLSGDCHRLAAVCQQRQWRPCSVRLCKEGCNNKL